MGGSARTWTAKLDKPLPAGTAYTLRLVLTKYQAPSVKVGYVVTAR